MADTANYNQNSLTQTGDIISGMSCGTWTLAEEYSLRGVQTQVIRILRAKVAMNQNGHDRQFHDGSYGHENGTFHDPGSTRPQTTRSTGPSPAVQGSMPHPQQQYWTQPTPVTMDEGRGPKADEKLAEEVNKGLQAKFKPDKFKNLIKKYPRAENCTNLVVRTVNPEVRAKLTRGSKSNDARMQKIQGPLVKSLVPIINIMDTHLEDRKNK